MMYYTFTDFVYYDDIYEEGLEHCGKGVQQGKSKMNRKESLELAIKTVCEDRQDVHGAPEDCFSLIGEYWSKYLDMEIDNVDVARMMIYFKMARLMINPKHTDNYIDLMGYAALAVELMGGDGE